MSNSVCRFQCEIAVEPPRVATRQAGSEGFYHGSFDRKDFGKRIHGSRIITRSTFGADIRCWRVLSQDWHLPDRSGETWWGDRQREDLPWLIGPWKRNNAHLDIVQPPEIRDDYGGVRGLCSRIWAGAGGDRKPDERRAGEGGVHDVGKMDMRGGDE